MRTLAALLSVGSLALSSASALAAGGVDWGEIRRLAAGADPALRTQARRVLRLGREAETAARRHRTWLRNLARREAARRAAVEGAARRARAEYRRWFRSQESRVPPETNQERARRVARELRRLRARARREQARRQAAEREARELVRRALEQLSSRSGPRAHRRSSVGRPPA